MNEQLEMAQLLARFKLQVKRALNQSVDLELLARDSDYARRRLAEIEEDALDEDLLVMVLRVRDMVLPVTPAIVPVAEMPVQEPMVAKETRSYLMGARSW